MSIMPNIALMTEEWAQAFKQRHVSVLTSFPSSDPATFDRIVGKQGAFQKVMRGLEIALASGVSVSANMVVMQDNKGHVYETGRFLHEHGIKNFSATKVHPAQQCRDFAPMQLRPGDVVSVLDDLLKLAADLGMETDTLTCYPICLLVDADKYGSFLLNRSCSAGKTAGTIGADGGVRPCSHSDDIYGNAITESLLDVWPRLREWRDGTFVPDRCKACKWMGYCGAGCRMDSKYFHGRRDQPDPYMIPENEGNVTMPQSESALDLDDDQMLFVNPELLYREESFGTIVTTSSGTHTITKDSGDLLLELSDEPFTLREIVGRYGLDAAEAKSFFGELLKKEVIYECELAEA